MADTTEAPAPQRCGRCNHTQDNPYFAGKQDGPCAACTCPGFAVRPAFPSGEMQP